MARRLNATVYLHDEDGVVRSFGPGDVVPDWVAAQITNPDVWEDDEQEAADEDVDSDGPPPKTGKGSSREAWVAYAAKVGVNVAEDASRDDIIAALANDD